MDIRRIGVDEWRAYRALRLEALRGEPTAFGELYDEAAPRPEQFWRDRVAASAEGGSAATYVAVDPAGRFVGMAVGVPEPRDTVQVVGVYVAPEHRGRGVAGPLVGAVVRWATERAARVHLYVTDGNDRAAAFYRRIGFVPTGVTVPYRPDPSILEHELVFSPQ